ncbi:MAG: hypothetical protein V3W41_21285 [Planctomycetota bacterium]
MSRIADAVVDAVRCRADMVLVAESIGLVVKKRGGALSFTTLRSEADPSTALYPAGYGDRSDPHWFDYGERVGGDAFALVMAVQGCSFRESVAHVAGVIGYDIGDVGSVEALKMAPAPPKPKAPEPMADGIQEHTFDIFCRAVRHVVPEAAAQGANHLRKRGVIESIAARSCLIVPAAAWTEIGEVAKREIKDPRWLEEAGVLREDQYGRGLQPSWHDNRALYLALSLNGGGVLTLTARALADDARSKYLAVGGDKCRSVRAPFNLPDLEEAKKTGQRLLIVEGPADAYSARSLGLLAIATGSRPHAKDKDDDVGAVPRMLKPYIEDFKQCSQVLVAPDNDKGLMKSAQGSASSVGLVRWLKEQSVWASVATLPDLRISANDLAEAAEAKLRGQAR